IGKAGAADVGFADKICPEATQYVVAVGKMRVDDPPQKVYDVAQAAADAYARCSKDKLSNGFREAQHYADVRGGQFVVIAARALIALNRADDARRELLHQRPLVQQVVDWQSETVTPSQGHAPPRGDSPPAGSQGDLAAIGSDHRPSMYRASAKDIVAAIDEQLARIDGASRDATRPQLPQPAASPPH
ncbi:MAG TPA: hypothetical protein VFF00_04700, partial [Candidatus Elarobacter sp.]|nr:hypothetical protein [Candidatus Elarobacter sp.]